MAFKLMQEAQKNWRRLDDWTIGRLDDWTIGKSLRWYLRVADSLTASFKRTRWHRKLSEWDAPHPPRLTVSPSNKEINHWGNYVPLG